MLSVIAPLVSVTDLVQGIPIHARVSTRPANRDEIPLVFVHGLGVSIEYMEPTMARLAVTHSVAGIDLPGFGRSGKPSSVLDVSALATALAQWLDVRRIGPAVFVGNSFGCQVIVEFAMQKSSQVLGLVLNAPTMDPAHRSVIGQLWRVLLDIPFEPWRLAVIVARDYVRAGPRRLLGTLRFALADRIEEKLPSIVAPTIIVCGARDPVITLRWASEAARLVGQSSRGAVGASLSVITNAAHALPYDDPITFAALIESFVDRVHRSNRPR